MYYKLAQLILKPSTSNSVSDIFISQPDNYMEGLAGKLFIVIELRKDKLKNESHGSKIINYLIDNLEKNYYQHEKIILRERIQTLKVEHIFEAALTKTNKMFNDFLKREKINIDTDSINITSGIIYEQNLYFANSGKNKTILIYKTQKEKDKSDKKDDDNPDKYKLVDLTEKEEINLNNKIFTNVISGHIPDKGYFIVSNEALPEYISNKQLISIITNLPPGSAAEQIKNTLSKINSYVPFLGLIIKSTATLEREEIKPKKLSTQSSISNLNRTEESTENILTPSGIINLKKWTKTTASLFEKKPKMETPQQVNLKSTVYTKEKSFQLGIITSTLLNIFKYIAKKIKLPTKKTKSEKTPTQASFNFSKQLFIPLKFLNKLSLKSKILFSIMTIIIILFTANLSLTKKEQVKQENTENYNNLITEIEQKQNYAAMKLLYSNEEGAKKIFDEIDGLLNELPLDTPEQQKKYDQFKQKFNEQLEEIQRVERIDNLETIFNFSEINSEAECNNVLFLPESQTILSADTKNSSLYKFNFKDSSNKQLKINDIEVKALTIGTITSDKNIYYFNNGSIIKYDTKNEDFSELTLTLTSDAEQYVGISEYNTRLYLLSKKENQVFRYNRAGSGFGSAFAWINEKVDFNDAIDLAIDGNIYVLKGNSELLQFFKNSKQDFRLENAEPTIEAPTKLKVSEKEDFIYILEPKNERIVVFDKRGEFIIQYKSNSFTDLKDIAVDEENKSILVLNGNAILKLPGEHWLGPKE